LIRIELMTPSLPRKCSTPELQRPGSGRRVSNPLPTAWKAVALPNELLPRAGCGFGCASEVCVWIFEFPFSHPHFTCTLTLTPASWGEEDSNLRRRSQQIYSLPHLTALESPQLGALICSDFEPMDGFEPPTG
jgi:hypothetical protein